LVFGTHLSAFFLLLFKNKIAIITSDFKKHKRLTMSEKERLPYSFDLHYDIKYMSEVEDIAKGNPHSSDATPEDLVELFIELELDVPECLHEAKIYVENKQTIWILPDGTWIDYEPLEHEYPNTRKVVISKF
jgi:hypothetical protein